MYTTGRPNTYPSRAMAFASAAVRPLEDGAAGGAGEREHPANAATLSTNTTIVVLILMKFASCLLQLEGHLFYGAGESERQLVSEVHRGSHVFADVHPFIER